MMQVIELYDDPEYSVQVVLDGVLYFLLMHWNSEAQFWTMGIEDYNRQTIIASIKLVPNYPLLERYRRNELPAGELVVISNSGTISLTDFADGYAQMVYVSQGELQ